jgi:TrmH family RNA methyltransferase
MGCVDIVPWERAALPGGTVECGTALSGGAADGRIMEGPFFALETGGTRLGDFEFPPKGVMIVGSEELGTSPEALALADASLGRVTIPAYGAKGSLNVSVAFGIVLQAWAEALAAEKGACHLF